MVLSCMLGMLLEMFVKEIMNVIVLFVLIKFIIGYSFCVLWDGKVKRSLMSG